MKLFRKIKYFFGIREAAKIIEKEPWFHAMFLLVSDATSGANAMEHNGLRDDAFLPYLRDAGEEYKEEFAQDIINNLRFISESENQTLACRNWIVSIVDDYAPITAFLMEQHDTDHPCLKEPLIGYADEIIEKLFDDIYRKIGNVSESKDALIHESMKLGFKLNVANIGRLMLEDCGSVNGTQDWYRRYILSAIANQDAICRNELGLEPVCNVGEISIEHLTIRGNLLKGCKDPLEGVKFAGTICD